MRDEARSPRPQLARRPQRVLFLLFVVFALGGCQAIFTYSPLSGLQRPPSSMTPAQRLTYAQNALASGDLTAMKNAYDAIKNDTSSQAEYTAAQLGIEISGVPTLLVKVAADPNSVAAQLNTMSTFIASNNLHPTYMVAAAAQLSAAQAAGATLTNMDMAMSAMGIILGGVQGANWDITTLTGTPPGTSPTGVQAKNDALAFLAPAVTQVALLPSGDHMKDFITQLNAYILGL
jgi:hypothetical protein